MMWFFRHFLIFISYHIFLLNQVEGAIAIPPSNSAPLPLFCPSVCPSVCPPIGLLTTFSGFCTFADKSLGRNGIEFEMQMFPDDLPLANIDADGYCCHFMRSSVRPTIHGLGFVYCIQSAWKKWPTIWHADVSRWLTLSIHGCIRVLFLHLITIVGKGMKNNKGTIVKDNPVSYSQLLYKNWDTCVHPLHTHRSWLLLSLGPGGGLLLQSCSHCWTL